VPPKKPTLSGVRKWVERGRRWVQEGQDARWEALKELRAAQLAVDAGSRSRRAAYEERIRQLPRV